MPRNHNWHCLVCRDKMTIEDDDDDPTDPESQEKLHVLVAATCGHLFHKHCLVQSCESKKIRHINLGLPPSDDKCPSCDRVIVMTDCRRIYPTELPENLELENLTIGNEQELLQKIADLTDELNRLKAKTAFQENKLAALEKKRSIHTVATTSSASRNDYLLVQNQLEGIGFSIDEILDGSAEVSLKRNDAVVWVTDDNLNGNAGIVRWLGRIDGIIYAGIEFDDPIGNDFRQSNGEILFETQMANTGRLVRVQELMMYKDFYGNDYYPPERDFDFD